MLRHRQKLKTSKSKGSPWAVITAPPSTPYDDSYGGFDDAMVGSVAFYSKCGRVGAWSWILYRSIIGFSKEWHPTYD